MMKKGLLSAGLLGLLLAFSIANTSDVQEFSNEEHPEINSIENTLEPFNEEHPDIN